MAQECKKCVELALKLEICKKACKNNVESFKVLSAALGLDTRIAEIVAAGALLAERIKRLQESVDREVTKAVRNERS